MTANATTLEANLATAADFNDDQPELAQLMRDVCARWVRTTWAHFDGALETALHAIQEADADYAPAADGIAPCLAQAVELMDELAQAEIEDGDDHDIFTAVTSAQALLQAHLEHLTR